MRKIISISAVLIEINISIFIFTMRKKFHPIIITQQSGMLPIAALNRVARNIMGIDFYFYFFCWEAEFEMLRAIDLGGGFMMIMC